MKVTNPRADWICWMSRVNMMQPDRLGIDSPPERAASVLNQWRLAQIEICQKRFQKGADSVRRCLRKPENSSKAAFRRGIERSRGR